jgi:hypothetical protein
MARAANYITVLNDPVTLSHPTGDPDEPLREFSLHKPDRDGPAVLIFQVSPLIDAGESITLTWTLNDNKKVVAENTFHSTEGRSFHRFFPSDDLKSGDNTLTLEATAGNGSIDVSTSC